MRRSSSARRCAQGSSPSDAGSTGHFRLADRLQAITRRGDAGNHRRRHDHRGVSMRRAWSSHRGQVGNRGRALQQPRRDVSAARNEREARLDCRLLIESERAGHRHEGLGIDLQSQAEYEPLVDRRRAAGSELLQKSNRRREALHVLGPLSARWLSWPSWPELQIPRHWCGVRTRLRHRVLHALALFDRCALRGDQASMEWTKDETSTLGSSSTSTGVTENASLGLSPALFVRAYF